MEDWEGFIMRGKGGGAGKELERERAVGPFSAYSEQDEGCFGRGGFGGGREEEGILKGRENGIEGKK